MHRRNANSIPIIIGNNHPLPPPPAFELPELELDELLDEDEELDEDELLAEELLLDEEVLLVLRTRMELSDPPPKLLVIAIVSLPSVIFVSNGAGFQSTSWPTFSNISTSLRTVSPSMTTLKDREPACWYSSSTKPSSTETRWSLTGISKVKLTPWSAD